MNILKQFYLVLALMMTFPCQGLAQVGRIELHTFQSSTLTDEEFLAGKKDANPVTIAGELRFPRQKMKRYPVVVSRVMSMTGLKNSIPWVSQFLSSTALPGAAFISSIMTKASWADLP